MALLGVGITTFNRIGRLEETVHKILEHTKTPFVLIVADDGSTDGTIDWLRSRRIPHICGHNRGVAWNKNRALYYLHSVRRCESIILIEDDTFPTEDGWELDWIRAASAWGGHANFAGHWLEPFRLGGSGTVEDPAIVTQIGGVCASFTREALDRFGYMDSRFKKYGFEHGEHTLRMLDHGVAGTAADPRAHYALASPLTVTEFGVGLYADSVEENRKGFARLLKESSPHRRAWQTPDERRLLFSELLHARTYSLQAILAIRLHFGLDLLRRMRSVGAMQGSARGSN